MSHLRDHGFIHEQLDRIAEHLEGIVESGPTTGRGDRTPSHVHTELLEAVNAARKAEADPVAGTYYSRRPVVSLAQSALQLRREAKTDDEKMGDKFTKEDIGWVVEIALSLLWRLLHHRHPFCDEPASMEIKDAARLVMVSDWGTGLDEAKEVAEMMRPWIEDSEGRQVHVVHLGDTYYSGLEQEVRDHILKLWPVHEGEEEGEDPIFSWALNGNHDMYSGGRGYFDTLLNDARFRCQRAANGAPTSWFSLQSKQWNVVGLDTAWNDELPFGWKQGHLYGGQADLVAKAAADTDRKLLLLSHHQLFTAGDDDDVGEKIEGALKPVLNGDGVDVWFWGHEHDCVAYHPYKGVRAATAIGHGAVPELADLHPPKKPDYVKWRYEQYRTSEDGEHWGKHGFAVLDLEPESIKVRHVDEKGKTYEEEELPGDR